MSVHLFTLFPRRHFAKGKVGTLRSGVDEAEDVVEDKVGAGAVGEELE